MNDYGPRCAFVQAEWGRNYRVKLVDRERGSTTIHEAADFEAAEAMAQAWVDEGRVPEREELTA